MDQLLLSIVLYIYPAATPDELCEFIVGNKGEMCASILC